MHFSQYEKISNEQFYSKEFQRKYKKLLVIDGSAVPSNSAIIQVLAAKMGKTEKAVYLMVKRKFCKPSADKENIAEIESSNVKNEIDFAKEIVREDESSSVGYEHHDGSAKNLESFNGKYKLQDSAIFEVEWTTRVHRGRQIRTQMVKEGWVSKLVLFIFKNTNLSCKFVFRNYWISKKGEINTIGKCECQSQARITYFQNTLTLDIKDIDKSFQHTQKYQMRGVLKEKLAENLKHDSALANEICERNDS